VASKQYLGVVFSRLKSKKNEIYFKTGIPRSRLSKLSVASYLNIKGSEFYLIALALPLDLNEMADEVFKDFKTHYQSNKAKGTNLTKFGQFISSGLIFQKTIAKNTGILESRLSKLALNPKTIPLAKEIYLSALAINRNPSDAFKFIYSDLKLNSLKEQERLRKEYEPNKN
jgi:hypothetical protein